MGKLIANARSLVGHNLRTNLCTNPSFELNDSSNFWNTTGVAGSVFGLTQSNSDNTYALFGTRSAYGMGNWNNNTSPTVGQYYLNSVSAFIPISGHTYTFSLYVFVPIGSPITSIEVAIRDYNNFTYLARTRAALTPGQWTRISCTYTATSANLKWRFTCADPQTGTNFTGTAKWWCDGGLIEEAATANSYFDGSFDNASWLGTADQAKSTIQEAIPGGVTRDAAVSRGATPIRDVVVDAFWVKLGMNYGNNLFGVSSYPTDQVNTDLDYLKSLGVAAIRIGMPTYNDAISKSNFKKVSEACRSKGIRNIWGVTYSVAGTIDASGWAAYKSNVLAQAIECEGWGTLDEFQLGNELELRSRVSPITDAIIRTDIASLATDIANQGVSFDLSYATPNGLYADNWIAGGISGLGGLDKISFNVYGVNYHRSLFESYVNQIVNTFGSRGYLSEWGIDSNWPPTLHGYDENSQALETAIRLNLLKDSGISLACFYTYRTSDDAFALQYNNGESNLMLGELKSGRFNFSQ